MIINITLTQMKCFSVNVLLQLRNSLQAVVFREIV